MPEHDVDPALFPTGPAPLRRRTVVAAAGGAALGAGLLAAGCSSGSSTSGAGAAPAPPGTALGATSAVPAGSAAIFPDQAVVVTQASPGAFAAFSTVCPHLSCNVATVNGADIVCPCHGSTFGLDGSVKTGPAEKGLTSRPVTVQGDRITLA